MSVSVARAAPWLGAGLCALAACANDRPVADAGLKGLTLSPEELMRPETCKDCHPQHYREWKSSMHAYAAEDPVFRAMNQRGQRETDGALGDFCVRCHAPMAVRLGATQDGLDLDSVAPELKGVTCYFCHNAVGHGELNNGDLKLADDSVMRGPLRKAVDPGVHGVAYSSAHDGAEPESSPLCGSCHDVVTPSGVALERTYLEYLSTGLDRQDFAFQSCQSCHMPSSRRLGPAAVMPGLELPSRPLHEHLWPGVDVALTDDFPDQDAQRVAVMCELVNAFNTKTLTADPIGTEFMVTLETTAGHGLPSGTAQDRRVWLQAVAYDAKGRVVFESGKIEDQQIEQVPQGEAGFDPFLAMLRDHIYDADGHEAHMFWEAAPSPAYPQGYRSDVLPPQTQVGLPHTRTFTYRSPVPAARFTVRMRVRPVGMDILHSLVESQDLDEGVVAKMPTFTILEGSWTPALGPQPVELERPDPALRCPDDYLCLLEPGSVYCH